MNTLTGSCAKAVKKLTAIVPKIDPKSLKITYQICIAKWRQKIEVKRQPQMATGSENGFQILPFGNVIRPKTASWIPKGSQDPTITKNRPRSCQHLLQNHRKNDTRNRENCMQAVAVPVAIPVAVPVSVETTFRSVELTLFETSDFIIFSLFSLL